MHNNRFQRVLRLLMFLQSGPRFNAEELAREFDVSRRTIFRDINTLRDMGIPVQFDEGNDAYRLSREYQFGKAPHLTGDELAALALAAHLSPVQLVPELAATVREATAKLLCSFPESVRTEIVHLLNASRAEFAATVAEFPNPDVLEKILRAIRTRRQIRLSIAQPREAQPYRTKVAPYGLVASARRWQLVGRSSVHHRTVTFEVSQIRRVEFTEDTFSVPHGFRHRTDNAAGRSGRHIEEQTGGKT